MTYTPTRETLELAAHACGVVHIDYSNCDYDGKYGLRRCDGIGRHLDISWQPHLPTTQGKADLLDLILALPMDVEWLYVNADPSHVLVTYWVYSFNGGHVDDRVPVKIKLTNNDTHAALAQAALEVAAQVGGVMRNNTIRGEV